ncbi:MAG: hypothetical protein DYG89_46065 [Caldilinea sp. CFX5]|nr:hypothetical protein [Caldilinea sp. CFX5]
MTTIDQRQALTLVNPDPTYQQVRLLEPTPFGYIHLAATVAPRVPPLSFLLPTGGAKRALLARLQALAHQLEQHPAVTRVTLFDATVIPPVTRISAYLREHRDRLHAPRFDVVALIETASPKDAHVVQGTPLYRALVDAIQSKASDLHIMTAHNAKRIGDVNEEQQGLFLFNYFVGDNPQVVLHLWEYLADWYVKETGLDNSLLLVPLNGEQADYVAINHARWDESLLRFFWQQFGKASFRHYVLANLEANRVGAMPVLYRLVSGEPTRRLSSWAVALGAVALGIGLTWWRIGKRNG